MIVSKRSPNEAFGETKAVLLRADSTQEFALGGEQVEKPSDHRDSKDNVPTTRSKQVLATASS
jgi:hypothetical protein